MGGDEDVLEFRYCNIVYEVRYNMRRDKRLFNIGIVQEIDTISSNCIMNKSCG